MYETKIGHAHLKVRDLDRAIAFYTRFLSQRVVERVGNQYAFLTGGGMHHEIALQNVGRQAPDAPAAGVGLYHIAFELPSRAALAEAYFALSEAGVAVAPVDHRISWALYFADPDGNGLELYYDTRREPGGTELWSGLNVPLTEARLRAELAAAEEMAAMAGEVA